VAPPYQPWQDGRVFQGPPPWNETGSRCTAHSGHSDTAPATVTMSHGITSLCYAWEGAGQGTHPLVSPETGPQSHVRNREGDPADRVVHAPSSPPPRCRQYLQTGAGCVPEGKANHVLPCVTRPLPWLLTRSHCQFRPRRRWRVWSPPPLDDGNCALCLSVSTVLRREDIDASTARNLPSCSRACPGINTRSLFR